jgi:hypothetical protein
MLDKSGEFLYVVPQFAGERLTPTIQNEKLLRREFTLSAVDVARPVWIA